MEEKKKGKRKIMWHGWFPHVIFFLKKINHDGKKKEKKNF